MRPKKPTLYSSTKHIFKRGRIYGTKDKDFIERYNLITQLIRETIVDHNLFKDHPYNLSKIYLYTQPPTIKFIHSGTLDINNNNKDLETLINVLSIKGVQIETEWQFGDYINANIF